MSKAIDELRRLVKSPKNQHAQDWSEEVIRAAAAVCEKVADRTVRGVEAEVALDCSRAILSALNPSDD